MACLVSVSDHFTRGNKESSGRPNIGQLDTLKYQATTQLLVNSIIA